MMGLGFTLLAALLPYAVAQPTKDFAAYWDAQPPAPAVLPDGFLGRLRKAPWPDARPVPKERYFERPEIKARELQGDEGDPLLAGIAGREDEVKQEQQSEQDRSDTERLALWGRNLDFFSRALADCRAGRTAGAERVKVLESLLGFVKEKEPRFHRLRLAEAGSRRLSEMGGQAQALIADLEARGEYAPDILALQWAERTGGALAGGITPVPEGDKRNYHKIVARAARFDPRAAQLGARPAAAAGAPVGAKDEKWEAFLEDLIGQSQKLLKSLDLSAPASEHKALTDKLERSMRKLLAGFPPGWQKYGRAKWAHGWLAEGLAESARANDTEARGKALYMALYQLEAGLR